MSNQTSKPTTKFLKDYQVPSYLIETIDLRIELKDKDTRVVSKLQCKKNPASGGKSEPLCLNGEMQKLLSIKLDNKLLNSSEYLVDERSLTILKMPDAALLEIETHIQPQENTQLSGLYRSGEMYCTQCEPQGFRRITYYLDRPDVLAKFTTTVVGNKELYPILLSNGNRIDSGDLDDGNHFVTWDDPFPKPAYLFALVAGNLHREADCFVTDSGRTVALEILVEPENKDKCEHAMACLKRSMLWDESAYGREYDLDIYMIVAVNDFNMGAMENKGLNIFNSKYVLADNEIATDKDLQDIEAVIGHEYFHNWSGNRVTCRDWFQLSLKEGLTVFREQQFCADMGMATVKRIENVNAVRSAQFAEDSGPMAHPVQPKSYIEINNFYTMTVYYKGSEVIRMLHTLIGPEGFRKGTDLYFDRFDGQAVTIDDFAKALSDANDIDLEQFKRWYHQAGTPIVEAKGEYNTDTKEFCLSLSQSCPSTPGQVHKDPFVIPLRIDFMNKEGKKLDAEISGSGSTNVIKFDTENAQFTFKLKEEPIPSLNGDFSAPIKLKYDYSSSELVTRMLHDPNLFNRWEASQIIMNEELIALASGQKDRLSTQLLEGFDKLLDQKHSDLSVCANMLTIPSFKALTQKMENVDVHAVLSAMNILKSGLSNKLSKKFLKLYQNCVESEPKFKAQNMEKRALKNVCLSYLAGTNEATYLDLVNEQFQNAHNMTDKMGALNAINHIKCDYRKRLLSQFYSQYAHEPLVVNKWLALIASSQLDSVTRKVQESLEHEGFSWNNPNKVYALICGFANNPMAFHHKSGDGYRFIQDAVVRLNDTNPQVASRVVEPLIHHHCFAPQYQEGMVIALKKILEHPKLSNDVYELVSKSLENA